MEKGKERRDVNRDPVGNKIMCWIREVAGEGRHLKRGEWVTLDGLSEARGRSVYSKGFAI